jgi:hypothetical protein
MVGEKGRLMHPGTRNRHHATDNWREERADASKNMRATLIASMC